MDVSGDVDVDVNGQSMGSDLHNSMHRQQSKTQHGITMHSASVDSADGGGAEDAKSEVESGYCDLHESGNK